MPSRLSETRPARKEIGPVVALLLAGVLLLSFGYLAVKVMDGETAAFDRAVMLAMRSDGDPADPVGPAMLEETMRDVAALGSYPVLIFVFVSVLGYFILIRKRFDVILVTATMLGGAVLNTILKHAIDRARPDLVPHAARVFTASFPSAHATLSAVVFLTLGALLSRAQGERRLKVYFMAVAIFFALSVGMSRVYLGVHYPTDVIAGWAVGSAWAMLCWVATFWLQQWSDRRDDRR